MKLTEISNKLTDFIKSNILPKVSHITDKDYSDNKFVSKLKDIIDNNWLSVDDIKKIITVKYTIDLPALHTIKDFPLLYILITEIQKKNDKSLTYGDFKKWFAKNHHHLDYNAIKEKSKNTDAYSVVYQPMPARKKLHQLLYENNFVTVDIQQHAETSDLKYSNIKFTGELEGLNIHMYYLDKYKPNVGLIINICRIMYQIAQQFDSPIKNYPELTIFAGLNKKIINKCVSGKHCSIPLTAENINSGSTYEGISVEIWRHEELTKVLIHELIHFFGFDFYIGDKNYKSIETYIRNTFCMDEDSFDRSNESYTEALALIIHSLIIAKCTKIDFNDIIKCEIGFSLFQLCKILRYFEADNINDILVSNGECKKNIIQRTSVLSYYIIKSIILISYDKFIEFIIRDGIIIKSQKIPSYNLLIKDSLGNKIIEDIIKNIINIKVNDEFLENTLRMSCFQV